MTKQAHPIGGAIRTKRAALLLSQRDLARAAGTTAAAVSHIERGIRKPSAGLLARLAGALQCPSDDLLSGSVTAAEGNTYVRQVVAAMKSFPPAAQSEVVDFCEYLKHRNRKRERKLPD